MLKDNDKFVKITPVQIDRHHSDKFGNERKMTRRWIPNFGKYFNEGLTVETLRNALSVSNVKEDKYSIKKKDKFILYRYASKPPIVLNTQDCCFYGIEKYIEKKGLDAVQYQAYMIVEILRKNGFSHARRGRARFSIT
jgi:hypothetical protein